MAGVGSKPGERRGGRAKGTPNKSTEEIRELVMTKVHGPEAIAEAARLMKNAQSEATKIAAINLLLDRGYGKSIEKMEHGGPDGGPITLEALLMARLPPAGEAETASAMRPLFKAEPIPATLAPPTTTRRREGQE